jgi:hypothetical protein
MKSELNILNREMFQILQDPRSTKAHKLEAGRIIAALHGLLVSSGLGESSLSTRDAVQLRAAQKEIAERLFRRKNQKKVQNRRHYIRKQLAQLTAPEAPIQENTDGQAVTN